MSPAVKKFGINFLQLIINVAAVGTIIMAMLWTFARPYVITEIDTRMIKNNEWVKDTYFEPLKRDLNVEEIKKLNRDLVNELTDVKIQMAELRTELRMMRR